MARRLSLSAGTFLLFFGKLADMFGRKPMFVASMGLFSVILVIIGFSKSPIFMDIFCGLVGLCSAAVVPPAVGTLGAVYVKPSKRKNAAFGCFSAGNPIGFAGGALMTGVVMKIFDWRASFWFLAIVYALFTLLTIWTVPTGPNHVRAKFNFETLKKFDILGTLLAILGIAMFSSSLTLSGDGPNGWRTSYVIALLVVGLVLIGCFIYWQHVFKDPLMPLWVWKDKNFSLLLIMTCFGFMSFSANSFWVSLYLQRVRSSSALEVAVQILPQAIGGILVNVVVALILHRVSNKLLMGIACVAYTGSSLLLGFMKEDSIYWALLFPSMVLSVIGADIQFSVTNSVAGGIFNTVTRLCQNIGLGITTAIYTSIAGRADLAGTSMPPYAATFHFTTAIAGITILMVPFLSIETQGGKAKGE
ncbi:MAG: hypothetical protein M1818_002443 [Claussenomyces sp. TS43310]|nr:MAG: hypothetical protein M1818_002443 [Claussenomyces sp. TS43310]